MQLNNFQIISLARSISFCQVSLSIEKFQVISILLKTLFHGLKLNPPLQMFLTQLKTSPREVRIRGTETESVPGFFKWSVNERGRGKLVAARNSGIFSLCASARRWPVSLRNPCFETRPNVSHWPQKPSGDSASFVTEFTFCTRSLEHSRGLNLSSQTLRSHSRL